jgi:hypothetical protein
MKIWFKHIYSMSITKQVLATYINHFWVHLLESTSTGVLWRNMVVTRFRARTHDPCVERQTRLTLIKIHSSIDCRALWDWLQNLEPGQNAYHILVHILFLSKYTSFDCVKYNVIFHFTSVMHCLWKRHWMGWWSMCNLSAVMS